MRRRARQTGRRSESSPRSPDAAERAAAAARAKRNAERAVKEKALQIYALLPILPEPVDYEQVHELRKRPEQSKRRLAQRWLELFKTKSEAAQAAHRAFHEIVTINLPSAADADADADDDDDNDGGSGYGSMRRGSICKSVRRASATWMMTLT